MTSIHPFEEKHLKKTTNLQSTKSRMNFLEMKSSQNSKPMAFKNFMFSFSRGRK
jgi:hypothetical protein